ncbi:heme oxygenase [Nocardioides sp. Soil797]|nr:heme oxygenase [Nocardioides sp. Soil797]
MTVVDQVVARPLSLAMKEGSQAEHTAAENSGFMSELLGGRVNEQGYADYLLRLRAVYEALETTGRELAGNAAVAAVLDPALERLAAIETDLDHWVGNGPRTVDSPAAMAYRERILASASDPALFLAHHYTRYLGDLSGGQAIGRILERTFGLDGVGVSFYAFPEIPKPKPYKDDYRAALDTIGDQIGEAGKARVVDEVKVTFGLNQRLFEELSANLASYRR